MDVGRQEPEIVTLTLPCEERFIVVARIVVGGLAARLDLPYEHLDDLQLAAEAVLAEPLCAAADDITVELAVAERCITMSIGPVSPDVIQSALNGEHDEGIGLGILLNAVVDGIGFDQRADGAWLRMDKRVPALQRNE